jgi:hypothetical protein
MMALMLMGGSPIRSSRRRRSSRAQNACTSTLS